MKKLALAMIMVLGTALLFSCRPTPDTLHGLMESYVDPGIKIKTRSPFSGTILIAKKGEIIFHEAYGQSDIEAQKNNTLDTKFGIGSVSKQFTAMLVMQLVEKEQLNLADTLSKHLPYLPKELADNITIHQLLSNTSGLPHYEGLEAIGLSLEEAGNTQYTPKSLAQLIGKTNPIDSPGAVYYYSSLGYHLLGALLEEVTGKSYAQLLDEEIVQPLGLKNTGFGDNAYIAKELAQGYRYQEVYGLDWWTAEHGGVLTKAPFRDQSTAYAAGGIHATVKDLFIWSEAIKSNKLLSPELTQKMLTPNEHGYCYGWVRNWDDIIEKNTEVRLYGHGGSLAGNSAFIAMYDDGTTIIYLANRNNLKAEEIIHQTYLIANNLKDDFRLKGYPNRGSYDDFIAAGGMSVLQDYFDRLSTYSGYLVHPSKSTMRGIMKIYIEAEKFDVADSLKNAFLKFHNRNENTINELGYTFLASDTPTFALDFFKSNTQKYPFSSNAWDSLGEAYLTYQEYKNAIECYTKAIEIGEKTNHQNLKLYKENLEIALTKSKS